MTVVSFHLLPLETDTLNNVYVEDGFQAQLKYSTEGSGGPIVMDTLDCIWADCNGNSFVHNNARIEAISKAVWNHYLPNLVCAQQAVDASLHIGCPSTYAWTGSYIRRRVGDLAYGAIQCCRLVMAGLEVQEFN